MINLIELESLINIEQKYWIVKKDNPMEVLMKISSADYKLLISGIFKADNITFAFNGTNVWISKEIYEKLKKITKEKDLLLDNLMISNREFTNPEFVENIEFKPFIFNHFKQLEGKIYLVSFNWTKKWKNIIDKILNKLKENNIEIEGIYYIPTHTSKTYDLKLKSLSYLLCSLLIGRNIKDEAFDKEETIEFNTITYFTSSVKRVNFIKHLQDYINTYYLNSKNIIQTEIIQKITQKNLILNYLTNNSVNPIIKNNIVFKLPKKALKESYVYSYKQFSNI